MSFFFLSESNLKKNFFIYLFLTVLGLHTVHRLSLLVVSRDYSFHRLLIAVGSLVAEHGL